MRFYWWLLVLLPVLATLAALVSNFASMWIVVPVYCAPVLLLAAAAAPFVLVHAVRATGLGPGDRVVVAALALAIVPVFKLLFAIWFVFRPPDRLLTIALTAAWVLLALVARWTLHRGVPAGWPPLAFALLPPVSVLVALAPIDRGANGVAQGQWPLVIASMLVVAVLFHRALVSPRTRDGERLLIVLGCVAAAALGALLAVPEHFGPGGPLGTPLQWGIAGALIAAWIALAVATRSRLRR